MKFNQDEPTPYLSSTPHPKLSPEDIVLHAIILNYLYGGITIEECIASIKAVILKDMVKDRKGEGEKIEKERVERVERGKDE